MNMKAFFGFLLTAFLVSRAVAQSTVDTVVATNLVEPVAVVATADGNLYVSDGAGHRVVRFTPTTGALNVLAGQTGVPGTNAGAGVQVRFFETEGMVAARGGLVVADSGNQLIRFVSFSGVVSNLAGAPGLMGSANGTGDSARFRYPLGLAADDAGNIFIADSKNNAIRKLDVNNVVTTVATGFNEPAAVAVGANGELWVADTRRHLIQRVNTNGVITIMAGVTNSSGGFSDSLFATESRFNGPRGLLWLGGSVGLLISDSGNNAIRRLFYNPAIGDYSVETYAGVPESGGLANGPALSALFNAPVGVSRDPVNGGFFVADRANRQIRRITTQPPLPPVSAPVIGYVTLVKDSFGDYVTFLNEVTSGVFNNAVVIAILSEGGTQTYFTHGPTPPSIFEDTIPAPGPEVGLSPPAYQNGRPAAEMPDSILTPQPDMTIKAIGTQEGRRSSSTVQARFQFKVGNPSVQGDNAAFFTLDNVTFGAAMWYTLDGSDPTNNPAANPAVHGPVSAGDVLSLFVRETNLTFKARGFKANFKPSDVSTKIFTSSNFVANVISLGFESGEASSDFVGAAGQRFYAPITLSVLSGVHIYSLQFNVVVTNVAGLPVDGTALDFRTMLLKPIPGTTPTIYTQIPPVAVIYPDSFPSQFTNLLATNSSANLLSVGWLERRGKDYLYDTLSQDLITYSQAHDTMFLGGAGKIVVGAYSFVIPPASADGETYKIKIDRPSGTADGVSQDVYIATPTNGAVRAVQTVRVGSRPYLVGDVAPFRWFNAGDFGNTNLLNSDVLQVFQSVAHSFNNPQPGSDFEDAMNSCCGDANHNQLSPDALFNGDDTAINQIVFGDTNASGQAILDVADIFVTFRRSLDPSLKWFARYWSGGQRQFVEMPNGVPATSPSPRVTRSKSAPVLGTPPTAVFSADDIVAAGNRTVQVPIRVRLDGSLPIRVVMLNLTVQPLDGSPALTAPVQFTAVAELGSPSYTASQELGNFAGVWLDNTVPGVGGSNLLGTLTVTLPENAPGSAAYRVHFEHLSASPNGLGVFAAQINDGFVTFTDRSTSSWNDGISDRWRLQFFGTVSNLLSAATADADGDGVSNWAEFKSGTDPVNPLSKLSLLTSSLRTDSTGGIRLRWPTGMNCRYVLEYSTTAVGGNWQPLATNLLGDGAMREFIDTNAAPRARFYRVRAE